MEILYRLKKKNGILFLEIPLLIESKLNRYFDKLIFGHTKKNLRVKRYLKKRGNKKLFTLLDKKQLPPNRKKFLCNHTIDNNDSLAVLKKNVRNLMKNYE